jgi:CRISPR-associated protein Cmr1
MALEEFKFDLLLNSPAFANDVPRGTKKVEYFEKDPKTRQSVLTFAEPPHYPVDTRGIRIPSLRGVLEFWYRALLGGLTDPGEIYSRQADLFGSAEGGQGLTIRPAGTPRFEKGELSFDQNPLSYIYLGYGPLQSLTVPDDRRRPLPVATSYHKTQARDAILTEPRGRFRFVARGRPEQLEALRKALTLLHLFGGIGSRSRRGWGSVEVEAQSVPKPPSKDLAPWIAATLGEVCKSGSSMAPAEPRFSALSRETGIYVTRFSSADYQSVLLTFYERFERVRSYWKKQPLAVADHTLEVEDCKLRREESITGVPKRLAFGMPYHPSGKKVDIEYVGRRPGSDDEITRRASPLLLKVIRLGNGQHAGVALFLKSSFFGDPDMQIGAVGKDLTQPFPGYEAIEKFFSEGWTKVPLP